MLTCSLWRKELSWNVKLGLSGFVSPVWQSLISLKCKVSILKNLARIGSTSNVSNPSSLSNLSILAFSFCCILPEGCSAVCVQCLLSPLCLERGVKWKKQAKYPLSPWRLSRASLCKGFSPTLKPPLKPPLICGCTAGRAKGGCQRGNGAPENLVVILFIPRTKNSPNPMAPPEEKCSSMSAKWTFIFWTGSHWNVGRKEGRNTFQVQSLKEKCLCHDSKTWLSSTGLVSMSRNSSFWSFTLLFYVWKEFFVAFVSFCIRAFGSLCFLSWTWFQGSLGCDYSVTEYLGFLCPTEIPAIVSQHKGFGYIPEFILLTAQVSGSRIILTAPITPSIRASRNKYNADCSIRHEQG